MNERKSMFDFVRSLNDRANNMLNSPDEDENSEMYSHDFILVYDGMEVAIPFDAQTYSAITDLLSVCQSIVDSDA